MNRESGKRLSPPGAGARPRMVRWSSAEIAELQRSILRQAGLDPAQVPEVSFRFLTLRDVRERLGLSTASIYRGMAAGKIPRPIVVDGITGSAP